MAKIEDFVGRLLRGSKPPPLQPGQPCGHPGCAFHVSHPCEGCGRYRAGLADSPESRVWSEREINDTLLGFLNKGGGEGDWRVEMQVGKDTFVMGWACYHASGIVCHTPYWDARYPPTGKDLRDIAASMLLYAHRRGEGERWLR